MIHNQNKKTSCGACPNRAGLFALAPLLGINGTIGDGVLSLTVAQTSLTKYACFRK